MNLLLGAASVELMAHTAAYPGLVRFLITCAMLSLVAVGLSSAALRAAPVAPGGTFLDDDASLHQGSIEAVAAAGITRGCNPPTNSIFCPRDPVTRGEMAAFLVRALGLPAAEPAGFADSAGSIFATDIDRLAAADVTRGCNPPQNNRFCPEDPVTRQQMAAFLSRALSLPEAPGADTFVDDDESVFEEQIEQLVSAGITKGCNPPDGDHFCPTRSVTRAEMATFIARALDLEAIDVPPRPYQLDVVSREAWGAAAPRGAFELHDIGQITIHHAGSLDRVTGPAQFLDWQDWHHHLGWPDLAYHFIVGRDGAVYEGRRYDAAGDTATTYDPTGHLLIVVEGNFDHDTPTPAQVENLSQMVAWAAARFDVPVSSVTGHRDHAATACPGDTLYALLHDGSVAARAAAIIDAGGVTMRLGS